jgi:hypothetical protein
VTGPDPRPLLLLDVDGVLVPFGFAPGGRPAGTVLTVHGFEQVVLATAATHLRTLAEHFAVTWCTGWREAANEHLLDALGLTSPLADVVFPPELAVAPQASWKLRAIDQHAGADAPLAWVDDAFDADCERWAAERPGATHLERTDPAVGLTDGGVASLVAFAHAVRSGRATSSRGPAR